MKKLRLLLVVSILIGLFAGCSEEKQKLYVLNWGEYIDPELVSKFEEEYDVDVVYEEVESNEVMYTKISSKATKYDVAFPSDYMMERMISEDMLLEIDKNIVTNFDKVDSKYYQLTDFDSAGQYYVPYFTGSIGILYNKDSVDEKDLTGWEVLWNDKYENQVYMYDSIRDAIAVGALYNDYSINTTDATELEEIENSLAELNSNLRGYGTDDLKNLVSSGDGSMAVVYSGDYIVTYDDQMSTMDEVNVDYFVPESGTNVWLDGMVIPSTSQNSELANKFINFMLENENAKQNAEWVGYTTTHAEVYEEFVNSDEEIYKTVGYVLPNDIFENSEAYSYLGEDATQEYSEIFVRVKK